MDIKEASQEVEEEEYDYEQKYNFAKNKCQELTVLIQESFQNVSGLMQNESQNEQFLSLLGNELAKSRNNIENIIKQDETLFLQTSLQAEVNQLRQEKQIGYQKMHELTEQIQTLQKQKSIWESEKMKGKKLIQELQTQIKQQNETSYASNGNIDTKYDDANGKVIELTNELEIAHNTHGELKKLVNELQQENKLLSYEVLEYRSKSNQETQNSLKNSGYQMKTLIQQQTKEYKEEMNMLRKKIGELEEENSRLKMINNNNNVNNKVKEDETTKIQKGKKNLIRLDTTTNWKDQDLESLKAEFSGALTTLTKKQIMDQTEKQLNFESKEEKDDNNNIPEDSEIIPEKRLSGGLLRYDDNEQLDDDELKKLQNELKNQIQQQAMETKKNELRKIFEDSDALHAMEDIQSGMDLNKTMIDNNTNDDSSQSNSVPNHDPDDPEEMRKHIMQLNKQKLAEMFKKQEENSFGYDNDNEKKALISSEDADEARKLLIQARKSEMSRVTEPGKYAQPQIKDQHFAQFQYVLDNIGIVNDHVKKALWDSLKESIRTIEREPQLNHPENQEFNLQVSNHRVFPSLDFKGNDAKLDLEVNEEDDDDDENNLIPIERHNNILKNDNIDPSLVENPKFIEFKKITEDGINRLKEELMEKNELLNQYKSDKQILNKNAERFSQEQSEREEKINLLNKEIMQLKKDNIVQDQKYKKELDKVINSKVKLIQSCSKEINDLRSLLRKYNTLVNSN